MRQQLLVLYCSKWQALRTGQLARYSADGGWTTSTGTSSNLAELRTYIAVMEENRVEQYLRVWRTLNYLNAVLMGYSGQQLSDSELALQVRAYRDIVSESYHARRATYGAPTLLLAGFVHLDDFGKYTAKEFKRLDRPVRRRILENLGARSAMHENRPELEWYLGIIQPLGDGPTNV